MIDLLQTNLLISLLTEAITDGLFPNESAADFFAFFFFSIQWSVSRLRQRDELLAQGE